MNKLFKNFMALHVYKSYRDYQAKDGSKALYGITLTLSSLLAVFLEILTLVTRINMWVLSALILSIAVFMLSLYMLIFLNRYINNVDFGAIFENKEKLKEQKEKLKEQKEKEKKVNNLLKNYDGNKTIREILKLNNCFLNNDFKYLIIQANNEGNEKLFKQIVYLMATSDDVKKLSMYKVIIEDEELLKIYLNDSDYLKDIKQVRVSLENINQSIRELFEDKEKNEFLSKKTELESYLTWNK